METRKNIRLKKNDYSQNGVYFITICTKDKKTLFWNNNLNAGASIARPSDNYELSKIGIVAEKGIKNISEQYPVNVDSYVVMPNHIHLLLSITNSGGRAMLAPTISHIIQQYKSYVTKNIGFSPWQKLFYDHIVRNEKEYQYP